tara:strand:- start:32772 stop:33206 length:435 start_codon:yes stop_codon:yes gene_type:complete
MSVPNVMPEEASKLVKIDGYNYVDVRSVAEFNQGHPTPAVNIPILHMDINSGQMTPNTDFVRVVKANFPIDTKLVLGCRSGQRSNTAAQLLQSIGYNNVVNMRGGFSGERTPSGDVITQGWEELNLGVSCDSDESSSYDFLATK